MIQLAPRRELLNHMFDTSLLLTNANHRTISKNNPRIEGGGKDTALPWLCQRLARKKFCHVRETGSPRGFFSVFGLFVTLKSLGDLGHG